MSASGPFLSPTQAAQRLGISIKALRVYEDRGLLFPTRSTAGWRAYGPDQLARAAEIVALRGLGLGLSEIASILGHDAAVLGPALARHQAALETRIGTFASAVAKVRALRMGLAEGRSPRAGTRAKLTPPALTVAFDLPWPWGGERFTLEGIRGITYIVGPLGSGKTRLARRLAEALPGAAFLELDRSATDAEARMNADPALRARVEQTLAWLVTDGATPSPALLALLAGLEAEGPAALVVDMVEQGLDQPSQDALAAHLRHGAPGGRPLFLLTRSSAILDLEAVAPDATILYCPANHSPPFPVAPHPGAPGYGAVATCLATPQVRARTEGVIACRPPKAAATQS